MLAAKEGRLSRSIPRISPRHVNRRGDCSDGGRWRVVSLRMQSTVHTCMYTRVVYTHIYTSRKRDKTLSPLSRASRETLREQRDGRVDIFGETQERGSDGGSWPPLAWIPWRVVHLRVKVLAHGTHARTHVYTYAYTHAALSARACLVSRGARSRVHVRTALQLPHERDANTTGTHARTYGATAEKCEQWVVVQSTSYVYNRERTLQF